MTAAKAGLKVIILDDETNVEAAIASKLPKALGQASSAIKPSDRVSRQGVGKSRGLRTIIQDA